MSDRHHEQRAALPVFPIPAGAATSAADWSLRIGGLVRAACSVRCDDLAALPASTLTAPFTCEEGWQVQELSWQGVTLRRLLTLVQPLPAAQYVAVGAGEFVTVLPLTALDEDAPLLAYRLNGEPLAQEHGGPLRLVAGELACYQSVKWIDRIDLVADTAQETAPALARARFSSERAE